MTRALLLLVFAGCATQSVIHEATSTECGTCHSEQYAQWKNSKHARSDVSEVYKALRPRVKASWGALAEARCVACHEPGHAGETFITCASCHLAVGNREDANGAVVVDVNAPVGTAELPAHAPHAVTKRAFFNAPNLCGTCHEVKGPGHLDEPTLTEFFASPREMGASCGSCHDGHTLDGVSLMQKALKLEIVDGVVRVTNLGAAHGVPTGMTALRDVWVDAVVDGVSYPRVIELGAELDAPVFTESSFIRSRSLAAGASREWPLPDGAKSVSASLLFREVREETMTALGLAVPEAEVVQQAN